MDQHKFNTSFDSVRPTSQTDARVTAAMRGENAKKRKTPVFRRLAPVLACIILFVGLGVGWNVYRNGGAFRFGPVDYENRGGTVRFSRSNAGPSAADAMIGNVRELTQAETQSVFTGKDPTRALGYFMTQELSALTGKDVPIGTLYCVEATLEDAKVYISLSGLSPKDTFSYDPANLGKVTVLNGTDVYGAYFITDPNSRGEQTVIYSTVFEKDGLLVETELAGQAENAAETAEQISALTEYLTQIDLPKFTLSATWNTVSKP